MAASAASTSAGSATVMSAPDREADAGVTAAPRRYGPACRPGEAPRALRRHPSMRRQRPFKVERTGACRLRVKWAECSPQHVGGVEVERSEPVALAGDVAGDHLLGVSLEFPCVDQDLRRKSRELRHLQQDLQLHAGTDRREHRSTGGQQARRLAQDEIVQCKQVTGNEERQPLRPRCQVLGTRLVGVDAGMARQLCVRQVFVDHVVAPAAPGQRRQQVAVTAIDRDAALRAQVAADVFGRGGDGIGVEVGDADSGRPQDLDGGQDVDPEPVPMEQAASKASARSDWRRNARKAGAATLATQSASGSSTSGT